MPEATINSTAKSRNLSKTDLSAVVSLGINAIGYFTTFEPLFPL